MNGCEYGTLPSVVIMQICGDAIDKYIGLQHGSFDSTEVCETAKDSLDLTHIAQVFETPLRLRHNS